MTSSAHLFQRQSNLSYGKVQGQGDNKSTRFVSIVACKGPTLNLEFCDMESS
jgi:hypothetical protein